MQAPLFISRFVQLRVRFGLNIKTNDSIFPAFCARGAVVRTVIGSDQIVGRLQQIQDRHNELSQKLASAKLTSKVTAELVLRAHICVCQVPEPSRDVPTSNVVSSDCVG